MANVIQNVVGEICVIIHITLQQVRIFPRIYSEIDTAQGFAKRGADFEQGRCSMFPRVEHGDADGLKMAHIPGHHRHLMDQGRGGYERVSVGTGIRDMERRAALGHSGIHRQNAI